MLTLAPTNWYSWDFRVLEGSREIALIDRHWFRERASFSLEGKVYHVHRTSVVRGTFVLEQAGNVLAEAMKPSAFRRRFEITVGPEQYSIEAAFTFGREFRVLRGATPVGFIRPVSFLRRTATAQVPSKLPREVQLFMIFLVLVLWKRAADAGTSSSG